ncbi:MAG TPA: hypothetical protein VHL57_12030, partial [Flavobacteriales bacterium]|nr:hypothetical protein [Flavobacteriales bacterium]
LHATRAAALSGLVLLAPSSNAQELAWAQAIGALGDDVVQSMTTDADGNVLQAGYFEGTVDLDPGAGQVMRTSNGLNDVFVQKLTADGALAWAFSVGGNDADYATGISVDADGNVYVTGAFNGTVDFDPGAATTSLTSAGEYDMFLTKFSADGALLRAQGIGGPGYDEPKCVAVGPLGNVYLLSYFSATIDADPGVDVLPMTSEGALDILLQKFDDHGELLWAQTTGSEGADLGLSMALDANENIWITGSFEGTLDMDPSASAFELTSAGAWDIFVTKRGPDGTFLWAGRMGGPENFDTGYDIAVDADGNAIVVGSFFGTGDFDPGAGVHELTAHSLGSDDVFVQKLSSAGVFQWAVGIGGTDADLAYGVALADDGRIDVTGLFSGTADFDPDASATFEMTTSSIDNFFDSYVLELRDDGQFLSAWQFGGANSIATQSIARGADEALFVAGHFENAADFDPGATATTLTSAGFRDAFTLRIDGIGAGVQAHVRPDAPVLFPNPASDAVMIAVDPALIGASYDVCDEQGRTVANGRLTGLRTRLAVTGLAAGRYHVRVLSEGTPAATFVVAR